MMMKMIKLINLKKDLLNRYQITETFNALEEKLILKNISYKDFLKNNIGIIECSNDDLILIISP